MITGNEPAFPDDHTGGYPGMSLRTWLSGIVSITENDLERAREREQTRRLNEKLWETPERGDIALEAETRRMKADTLIAELNKVET